MMDLDAIPGNGKHSVETSGGTSISSAVFFAGAWQGAMTVECSQEMARMLSSRMAGLPEGQLAKDDVVDSIGELANMLGGNMKCLLPAGTTLSMPSVVEGRDYLLHIRRKHDMCEVPFLTEIGTIRVSFVDLRN